MVRDLSFGEVSGSNPTGPITGKKIARPAVRFVLRLKGCTRIGFGCPFHMLFPR